MNYNNELEVGSERVIIPEIRENSFDITDLVVPSYHSYIYSFNPYVINKVSKNIKADLENSNETNIQYHRNINKSIKHKKQRVYKYHPKLLKIFTTEELDRMIKISSFSTDKSGLVNVIVVMARSMMVEIFTDCEAKDKDHALLIDLWHGDYLSKELFWGLFEAAIPQKVINITVDV